MPASLVLYLIQGDVTHQATKKFSEPSIIMQSYTFLNTMQRSYSMLQLHFKLK